jgi:hypothetical protein
VFDSDNNYVAIGTALNEYTGLVGIVNPNIFRIDSDHKYVSFNALTDILSYAEIR